MRGMPSVAVLPHRESASLALHRPPGNEYAAGMTRASAGGTLAEVSRARRLLASCRVALLDMNSTFMFEEDRLGPEEDFGVTYQAAGGRLLAPDDVRAIILACVERMSQMYGDQTRIDDFPSVLEVLSAIPDAAVLPVEERRRLADVVARHERGQIPAAYANAIQRLARTHRLGLITNIWAPKDLWLEELARAGLANEFAALVFSSDSRRVKPSRVFFAEALRLCRVEGSGPYRECRLHRR